jgi:hypothetical protein
MNNDIVVVQKINNRKLPILFKISRRNTIQNGSIVSLVLEKIDSYWAKSLLLPNSWSTTTIDKQIIQQKSKPKFEFFLRGDSTSDIIAQTQKLYNKTL